MIGFFNKLRDFVYVPAASAFFRASCLTINRTLKFSVVGEENIRKVHKKGEQAIFAFWHQSTFTMFNYYKGKKIAMIPVDNYLGSILTRFAKSFGFRTIRYPQSGTPAEKIEALAKLIKAIKEGWDCGVAVDGPPDEQLYKAKPGIFFIASRTGYPILPAAIYYERAVTMGFRWDKYLIPLPFSRATLVIGEPIYVAEKYEGEKLCRELEKKLFTLTDKAKDACLSK